MPSSNGPTIEFSPEGMRKAGRTVRTLVILGLAAFLLLAANPLVIIGPGQRGVVMNFGAVQPHTLSEGLHLRIPVYQRIVKADVRVQKEQTEAAAASKDLQDTNSTVAVNFHIVPDKAGVVYQTIGESYRERIIDPVTQEVVKAVTAKYTAVELITLREKVRMEIKEMLRTRLSDYHINVVDFSIVNFKFSQQFTQAIESKQTAEQLALKAQRDLDRIRIEAQQKIASAQAEAESLRLQKQNVTPELVQLRAIEAQMEAIRKWNGVLPSVTGGALPFVDAKGYVK